MSVDTASAVSVDGDSAKSSASRAAGPTIDDVLVVEHLDESEPGPTCSVAWCPVCTMVTALGAARPELLMHMLLAGREVLLALRAVIDARLEARPEPRGPLERIDIG